MKLYTLPLVLALGLSPVSFNLYPSKPEIKIVSCDNIPELNQKIIDFVNSKMNKTVGRGECWDLAAQALNTSGAKWDKSFGFGKEVDQKKDCIYPGDIIQFNDVIVEYSKGTLRYKEKMAQHTAVIYEVKGTGDYVLADQNTTIHGRKVGLSPMNLKNVTSGKYAIYQPVQAIKK